MTDETYPTAPAIAVRDIHQIAHELGVDAADLERRLRDAEAAKPEAPAAATAADVMSNLPPLPAAQAPAAASTVPPVPALPEAAATFPSLPPVPSAAPAAVEASSVELPAVTHNKPILTYGAAGQDVEDLVRLLAVNGYPNTTFATGDNASRVLDNSVMSEVKRFASDHGIGEQVEGFQGLSVPAASLVGEHVGPYIWQALIDGARIALKAI